MPFQPDTLQKRQTCKQISHNYIDGSHKNIGHLMVSYMYISNNVKMFELVPHSALLMGELKSSNITKYRFILQ